SADQSRPRSTPLAYTTRFRSRKRYDIYRVTRYKKVYRVSLSEEPEAEVPVAQKLVEYINKLEGHEPIVSEEYPGFSPFSMDRRETDSVWNVGGEYLPVVISDRSRINDMSINPHFIPDYIYVGNRVPDNFPKGMKSIVDVENWSKKIDNFTIFTDNA